MEGEDRTAIRLQYVRDSYDDIINGYCSFPVLLCVSDNHPVFFHCVKGKDRMAIHS